MRNVTRSLIVFLFLFSVISFGTRVSGFSGTIPVAIDRGTKPDVNQYNTVAGLISPKILAMAQGYSGDIVVRSGYAYWVNSFPSIQRVSLGNVVVSDLTNVQAEGMDVYQNYVYFDNNSGVFKVPIIGGTPSQLMSYSCPYGYVCVGYLKVHSTSTGTFIYFMVGGNLGRISINGGPMKIIFNFGKGNNGDPLDFIISGTHIYYYSLQGGIIGEVPLDGGAAKVLHSEQLCGNTGYAESNLVVANGFLYWTDNPVSCGGVYQTNVDRMSVSGGRFTTLFSKNTTSSIGSLNGLAFYNGKVLFGYDDFVGTSGGIYSVSSAGGVASRVSSAAIPVSLVISSGKLFYCDNGVGQIDEIPA